NKLELIDSLIKSISEIEKHLLQLELREHSFTDKQKTSIKKIQVRCYYLKVQKANFLHSKQLLIQKTLDQCKSDILLPECPKILGFLKSYLPTPEDSKQLSTEEKNNISKLKSCN